MLKIFCIYSKGCKECEKAQSEIDDAISSWGVDYYMYMLDIEEPDSLEIAIKYNLGGDIPSCVIESETGEFKTIDGEKITKKKVLKLIQELSK